MLRGFGGGKHAGEIVVLNDEAHHCYMDKPISAEASAEGIDEPERHRASRRLYPSSGELNGTRRAEMGWGGSTNR